LTLRGEIVKRPILAMTGASARIAAELPGEEHSAGVAQSAATLLEAIGEHHELTLVRGFGNLGDELMRAGTHRLLGTDVFREIDVDDLPYSRGDTVLLPGARSPPVGLGCASVAGSPRPSGSRASTRIARVADAISRAGRP
jgi:hypothetical protein